VVLCRCACVDETAVAHVHYVLETPLSTVKEIQGLKLWLFAMFRAVNSKRSTIVVVDSLRFVHRTVLQLCTDGRFVIK